MNLKRTLDKFYREYDFEGRVSHDPIAFPMRYKRPEDIEVAGFISTCFAYGRVGLFKKAIESALSVMGRSPYAFLMGVDLRKHMRLITFKYRFNDSADITGLLYLMGMLLKKHGSLEKAFMAHYREDDLDVGSGISGFIGEMLSFDTSAVFGRNIRPFGLKQFLPTPLNGSACKRMNLFLRWMVRDRDIDFGIWKAIPKNRLVIPLDTHIARISRCIGLTQRQSSDWKTAIEITGALRKFDSEDPVKYDFALCHHGISGMCKGKVSNARNAVKPKECEGCVFNWAGR